MSTPDSADRLPAVTSTTGERIAPARRTGRATSVDGSPDADRAELHHD